MSGVHAITMHSGFIGTLNRDFPSFAVFLKSLQWTKPLNFFHLPIDQQNAQR
jgi:hypothetical protein